MASPYEKRIQSILKDYVTPFLKENGFTRNKNVYYGRSNELTWLIQIQRSMFNDATDASFTFECGIYIPGLVSHYIGRKDPTYPKQVDCALRNRLGSLADDHLDKWWELTAADDSQTDVEIGQDVAERLLRDGLPFLHRFQSREDVLNFLLSPRTGADKIVDPREGSISLIYASILCLLSGDLQRSHSLWDKAVQIAAKGPEGFTSILPTIYRRIFEDSKLHDESVDILQNEH